MSKILFLGASAFQLAPIKYAKSVGHHTIVCDYLPDAPGHKIADEGFVTSTTDKEAVLKLAKDETGDQLVRWAVILALASLAAAVLIAGWWAISSRW